MKYDKDEILIKEALDKMNTPKYDFKREVKTKIVTKQRPLVMRRKFNIGLIATIIVILSGTVIASTLPSINRLISIISPEMSQILQPIQEEDKGSKEKDYNENRKSINSTVDQGIEIKSLAVINDDDMVIIYLTIQDLEQDRINETLTIGEYFVEGGTIHNAEVIDYNKESKTAIVQVTTQGGKEFNNKSIEVTIKSLLTSREELDQLPINLKLSDVPELSDSEIVWMTREDTQGGGGSGDMWNILEADGQIKLLKPNQIQLDIPEVEGIAITNVGFIDGRIHIQTKWEENDKDRHGYFYLVDQRGEKIKVKENNFYFGVDKKNEIQFGRQYVEYILDIDKENIEQLKLVGYFAEDGEVIEGEWNQEVDLNAVGNIIKIPCDIQAEGWDIKEVSVSPLGVTLKGTGTVKEKVTCSILMESGEIKVFDSISTSNQAGDIIMKLGVLTPLDVNMMTSIQIGKDIINLK
ncbi:MAG: hypothetical protein AB9856_05980 [Cellulosilyticaceae bacterium]